MVTARSAQGIEENTNVTAVFKKDKEENGGNYKSVGLILTLGKVMEQLALVTISRHIKDKKGNRNSHHRFTKGKSFLNNLMNFNNEMTGLTKERKSVDIIYLDFNHRIMES